MTGTMARRDSRIQQINQTEHADCALACLVMIARSYGSDVSLTDLKNKFSTGTRGVTFAALATFALDLGLLARAVRAELDDLDEVSEPVILHWNLNHFVVFSGKRGGRYLINDPSIGERTITQDELSASFTGVLMTFEKVGDPLRLGGRNIRLRDFLQQDPELVPVLAKVAVLSLAFQAAVLTAPLLLQLVLDRAVPTGSSSFLAEVALVFAAVALAQFAAFWLRGTTLNKMAAKLSLHFSVTIASILMRLEASYFIKRGIGDVLSRMLSIAPIRDLLSGRLGSVALDLALTVAIAVILLTYSLQLAAITFASLVIQTALQMWLAPQLRNRQSDGLIAKAKEQSLLIESIRGIATLKLFNLESERLSKWYSHLVDATEAEYRSSKIRLASQAGTQLILNLEFLLIVFIGASFLVSGELSIGQFVAFITYRSILTGKIPEILAFFVDLRVASLHFERLSDVAGQSTDKTLDNPNYVVPDRIQSLDLRSISFSYTSDAPAVIVDLSLSVLAGDHIAIKGVSGSGKSTLVRILLGLLQHDRGNFFVNGMRIEDYGYPNYRKRVASVLQDDNLFTGTILQNIAMFDPAVDFIRVQECAIAAAIHSEILEMQMAYQTLISDSGGNLSGGQKQRLLIARALYRQPQILVIDEGTANLDVELEKAVNDNIDALGITRIVFAHRPQTIDRADDVFVLMDGALSSA